MALPSVGSTSRNTARPVVVLPEPDSPTTPSVSPRLTQKLTPSTALTWPTVLLNRPLLIGKYFFSPLTCSSTSLGGEMSSGVRPRVSLSPFDGGKATVSEDRGSRIEDRGVVR